MRLFWLKLCLYFTTCTPILFYGHTQTHTCLSLFAVCFTVIVNTPLPSVHFTHDVAHLFTHLSGTTVCVCACVRVVSCHARLERCWSAGQADGIWPYPGVIWHVGMQDSKLNGQELVHMAVRRRMCKRCICNSSSGVLSTHFPLLNNMSVHNVGGVINLPSVRLHSVSCLIQNQGPAWASNFNFNFPMWIVFNDSCFLPAVSETQEIRMGNGQLMADALTEVCVHTGTNHC